MIVHPDIQSPLGCEYTRHSDGITAGGVLFKQIMTLGEAKVKCVELPNCSGFTFAGKLPADNSSEPIDIDFKDHATLGGPGWSSFVRVDHRKKLESCEARLAQSRAAFDNLHGMSNEYFFQEHKLPISPGGLILQETMTIAEAKRRCAELSNCKGFTFPGSPTNGSIHIELKDKSELGGQGEWTSYLRADYKHLSLSSDTDTSKLEASKKVAELALADAKKSLKDVEQQLQSKDARIAVLERQNHELEQNAVKLRSSEESCKSARNSLERELNEHDEIMKQMEEVSTELKWKLDEKNF